MTTLHTFGRAYGWSKDQVNQLTYAEANRLLFEIQKEERAKKRG